MPQSILIQVGQCGNQVGFSFWKYALAEYEMCDFMCEDDINYFFEPTSDGASGKKLIDCYKARGVLIDMEENVISQGIRSPIGNLFRQNQILTDVSGSGNNWAVGHLNYGTKHKDKIADLIRREAERCNALSAFLLTFSLGGGTGSGLGTFIINHLEDYYGVSRIVFPAFPSLIDDVVTSPYNAILANKVLIESATLVIPFENQILDTICQRQLKKQTPRTFSAKAADGNTTIDGKPFDDMNRIIAYSLLDFTSSSRLPGTLNLDTNDIVTNLVPSRSVNFVTPALAPLSPEDDSSFDQLLKDVLSGTKELTSCTIKEGKLISSIIQARGNITPSEIKMRINEHNGVDFRFYRPNEIHFTMGICQVPRVDFKRSIMQLSNSTAIASSFRAMKANFSRMYEKKAHLHHFLNVDQDIGSKLDQAVQALNDITADYGDYENALPDLSDSRPVVL